jgi:hypothetical protein
MFVSKPTIILVKSLVLHHARSHNIQIWTPVRVPELKTCCGLMFVYGIIDEPDPNLSWTDYVLETSELSKPIGRKRTENIL